LAVLGFARIPSQWVEIGIAATLVVVALELCTDRASGRSMLRDRPWLVSFCFGLLHGMGFAGALQEAGLPSEAVHVPLIFFNVGIELGQLCFIAAVIATANLAPEKWQRASWLPRGMAYVIGTLAVFWILERSAAL
jgi:hypothetical protein